MNRRDLLNLSGSSGGGAVDHCVVYQPSAGEVIDSALWACWYDLPEGREAEYLTWLHTNYMPRLRERPGFGWVAHYRTVPHPIADEAMKRMLEQFSPKSYDEPIGTGSQYILMGGGTDIRALAEFALTDQRQAASQGTPMLALRQGYRSVAMREIQRIHGPSASSRPPHSPPAERIQFGTFRLAPGREEQLWRWYLARRGVQMGTMEGAVMTRQFVGLIGWARVAVLYEFFDKAAHENFFKQHERGEVLRAAEDPQNFNAGLTTIHAPGSPYLAERLWAI